MIQLRHHAHLALPALTGLLALATTLWPGALPTGHASPPAKSFSHCAGDAPLDLPAPEGFEKSRYQVFLADQEPGHAAQDVMAAPGDEVVLAAKFAYGDASKDLEEEPVRAFVYDCTRWHEVGTDETDDDGRSRIVFDTATLPGPGVYEVVHVVVGDASHVSSQIALLPPGTQAVVFDIDGTLTTGDDEVFEEILDSDDAPTAVADAAALTRHWHERGYVVIYLTGRIYWLMPQTRRWLRTGDFAPGLLRTTDRHRDAMPGDDAVGAFKLGVLRELAALDVELVAAYGNASTDVHAYVEANVNPARVFIRGGEGGDRGTVAVGDTWTAHLEEIADLAEAAQPW